MKEIFLKIDRELSLIIDLFPVNCELLYQGKLRCSTSLLLFFSPSFFKILKVIGIILFFKTENRYCNFLLLSPFN